VGYVCEDMYWKGRLNFRIFDGWCGCAACGVGARGRF